MLDLDAQKYRGGVVGAGVYGKAGSSIFVGTGLRMNLGLVQDGGESVSKGVKTNVFWVKSHSAVNVRAVPGVAAVNGVARVVPIGKGDGGRTRWTPLTRPRRRFFLIFNGAVSVVGAAYEPYGQTLAQRDTNSKNTDQPGTRSGGTLLFRTSRHTRHPSKRRRVHNAPGIASTRLDVTSNIPHGPRGGQVQGILEAMFGERRR